MYPKKQTNGCQFLEEEEKRERPKKREKMLTATISILPKIHIRYKYNDDNNDDDDDKYALILEIQGRTDT